MNVYKRSYKLALDIFVLMKKIPREYQYDIGNQLRRASRAVPANIAEGCARQKSEKDTINFLRTALGSNDEVFFHLEFSRDAGLLSANEIAPLLGESEVVGKQLNALIKRVSSN